jgi:RNA polymerase sigma-70 factor (ECF subfamily)
MTDMDEQFVNRVQQGDRKAFEMLVARYERPVFSAVYRLVRDFDDAADITQTAFLKAYRKIATCQPAAKFFSWLYRIAVNESLNHLKRQRRQQVYRGETSSSSPTPETEYDHAEVNQHLERALSAMSLDQRVPIILKHLLFLSYSEIAGILDIPESTVKSRLYTARQVLKDQLIRQGYTR